MSDWLHNLPVLWMSLLVFGFTYLVNGSNLCGGIGLCRGRASALVQGNFPGLAAALGDHLRPFRCVHREPGLD